MGGWMNDKWIGGWTEPHTKPICWRKTGAQ